MHVFYIKNKTDWTIKRYKARLVEKGYTQVYCVDYQEMFSQLVKLNIVWVLISLATNLDWSLHGFYVKKILSSM